MCVCMYLLYIHGFLQGCGEVSQGFSVVEAAGHASCVTMSAVFLESILLLFFRQQGIHFLLSIRQMFNGFEFAPQLPGRGRHPRSEGRHPAPKGGRDMSCS